MGCVFSRVYTPLRVGSTGNQQGYLEAVSDGPKPGPRKLWRVSFSPGCLPQKWFPFLFFVFAFLGSFCFPLTRQTISFFAGVLIPS